MIDDLMARLRGEYYRMKFKLTTRGRVQIGRNFKAYAPIDIGGTGRITLGDDVTVRRDAFGNREVSLQTMYTPDAAIEIGSGVTLSGTHISAGKRVAYGTPVELRRSAALPLRLHLSLDQNGHSTAAAELLDAMRAFRPGDALVSHEGEVELELGAQELLAMLDLGARHHGAVRDLRVKEPPFDEVYRRLLDDSRRELAVGAS